MADTTIESFDKASAYNRRMSDKGNGLSTASINADFARLPDTAEREDRDDLRSLTPHGGGRLDRLIARHGGRVFRYIKSSLHNRQACEDLTQEVFMRLCRGGYDGTASPKTWMFTIARRCVIDFLRRESRQPAPMRMEDGFERADLRAVDPAASLTKQDEDRRILDWLEQLPDEQAEAVRLRIIADLSFVQTAQLMECSVPTAKSRLRYGLMKLRTLLHEENKS